MGVYAQLTCEADAGAGIVTEDVATKTRELAAFVRQALLGYIQFPLLNPPNTMDWQ